VEIQPFTCSESYLFCFGIPYSISQVGFFVPWYSGCDGFASPVPSFFGLHGHLVRILMVSLLSLWCVKAAVQASGFFTAFKLNG
jgi:hypothetical protein